MDWHFLVHDSVTDIPHPCLAVWSRGFRRMQCRSTDETLDSSIARTLTYCRTSSKPCLRMNGASFGSEHRRVHRRFDARRGLGHLC